MILSVHEVCLYIPCTPDFHSLNLLAWLGTPGTLTLKMLASDKRMITMVDRGGNDDDVNRLDDVGDDGVMCE